MTSNVLVTALRRTVTSMVICVISVSGAFADISTGVPSVRFSFGSQTFVVTRDTISGLPDPYARPPATCPDHCIEPTLAAPGVATLTELDVLSYMQGPVSQGSGLLVDARLPESFADGTLPGAISVPAPTLVRDNPYREDLLLALGARRQIGQMDFSAAFDLLIFDDGPWSPTARLAIERLLDAGYPAEKISYYRGGLQMWHVLGLSVMR